MTNGTTVAAQVTIDGVDVPFDSGDTILAAARRAGLGDRIPTLCYRDGSPPEGGCALCLVEVDGLPEPVHACHTGAQPGARIRTATDALALARRSILELIRSGLPAGALEPARGGGRRAGEFADLLARHGLDGGRIEAQAPRAAIDRSHPYLRFDPDLCIVCRRCVNTCADLQGQFVYGIGERGHDVRLLIGADDSFLGSPCTACGACVDECPTGALFDRDRERPDEAVAPRDVHTVRSTCGYCGVGCGIEIVTDGRRVLRIDGAPDSPVNRGHLCAKGRYAHGYQSSGERLTDPLLRRDGRLEPVSWDEAIGWLAGRLSEIHRESGPEALGALTSSRSTNEANYLLQKLFRTAFGTNNVDNCARVCHASTALALRTVTGTGAASASYVDIEQAGCIVVVGANPTEAHPVVGARIKQAARRGARLIVIDPRRTELVDWAAFHLPLKPGTNVALFNALARVLLDEGLVDQAYLDDRVDGLDELRAFIADHDVDEAAGTCRLDADAIRAVARLIGTDAPVLFVHGLGLSELTQGTASVMTLCNLGMLTGSIGRPGGGMLPLRGQNNVQGNADMGAVPNLLTGYQPLDDPAVRERHARDWARLPPETPGLTIPEMIDAAADGRIRALWIQGEDVAQSDPNQTHVLAALERLDLLVVQELFLTPTAEYAHLVLPSAGALEQDGTFTNGERRIQRVRKAVEPPGRARADWRVVGDVAAALGEAWSYAGPADVMDEIARVAPHLFGGVAYDRLGNDGLQWPCPAPDHPGTARVHERGFLRGRGQLTTVDHAPSPEHDVDAFPFLLITGRVLQHYNVGTMTRRTPNAELVTGDVLEINPQDAEQAGIDDADRVRIESRHGATEVMARRSERIAPGTLFLSFHFPESHTNVLTGPHVDPLSKCPDYKVTAVRLVAAA